MAEDESRGTRWRRRGSSSIPTSIQELLAAEPSLKKPSTRNASSARARDRLAEARFLLEEEDANSANALGFVHAVMSQIGLPRSPQKERVWTRSNGAASLTVLAGGITKRGVREEQPLPQGPYARLILADISTYAVRHKTPVIPMESSVSAYMRKRLKLLVSGGTKGTYTSFKREAIALASAHVELSLSANGVHREVKGAPVEEFAAWNVDEGEQQALWPCELLLSDRFFKSLREHALPVDMRAYRALGHSAFAQDIYTWLVHRLPRLKKPLELKWPVLASQFGGYADVQKFRRDFLKRLKEAHAVYPDARFEVVRGKRGEAHGGLLLKPSLAAIYPVASVVPGFLGAPAVLGDALPSPTFNAPPPRADPSGPPSDEK
jgi:hypothetical protein